MIYILIFLILFFSAIIFDCFKFKQNYIPNAVYVVLCISILCFAAFRLETGYDYAPYRNMFDTVKSSSLDVFQLSGELNIELGYVFLMSIFKSISFELFVIIISIVAIVPKVYFIYKLNKNKFLMLFCYYSSIYLTYDMGIMRQAIALSIVLCSIKYIIERKFVKFLSIVIIAFLFHSTSLIFCFIYLLKDKECSLKLYIICIIVALVLPFIINSVKIISIFSVFSGLIGSKAEYYYYYYEQGNIFYSLVKRVVIILLFLYFSKTKKKYGLHLDSYYWLSLNAYLLSILFMSTFSDITMIAARGTVSLYMFQIVCFGYIKSKRKSNWNLAIYGICLILFFNSFIGPLKDEYNFYLPYTTWIST